MKRRTNLIIAGLRSSSLALLVVLGLLFFPKPKAPSISVQHVRQPLYPAERDGNVLFAVRNDDRADVFLQAGRSSAAGPMWYSIEKKVGDSWTVESKTKQLAVGGVPIGISANRIPGRTSLNFRLPWPADGQTRRLVLRWKVAPRRTAPWLRRAQMWWWQQSWNNGSSPR